MSPTITKDLDGKIVISSPGVSLVLDNDTAWRIGALAADVASTASEEKAVVLPEGHPMWDHHSGGGRHSGKEWTMPESIPDARKTRRHLAELKARDFFELLLSEPGRLFSSEEIIETLSDQFASASAVAGCLNGFVKPCTETGHPFPFHWWEGAEGKPTRYAVRPSVAQVFAAAGD